MPRYLVLGASGLIGRSFLQSIGRNAAVGTYLSHPFEGGVRFDLAHDEIEVLLSRLDAGFTHALILGGVASIDACARDPVGTARVNVEGVIRAVDALVERGIVPIFASSDGVYDGSHQNWREGDPIRPALTYGSQKLAVEQYLEKNAGRWLALRIAKTLDPTLSEQGVLGPWLRSIDEGNPLRCATDQFFSPIAVDDVVAAMCALANADEKGIFNVGGLERVSRFELASMTSDALLRINLKTDPRIVPCSIRDFSFVEPRPLDTSLSIAKLQGAVGFRPKALNLVCEMAATRYAARAKMMLRG